MKQLRTIKRSDLGRLVYKYSHRARFLGIDVAFAFGKDYIMGNLTYFKRCPFHYIMTKPEIYTVLWGEKKIVLKGDKND